MKYFQILLLLGINFSTFLFGQSIEIPHKLMKQDTTLNIPIFIYDVSNLQSIQLKIEYDENIVNALEIIKNPVGILDDGYTFTTNILDLGIIHIGIGLDSENFFSGSGMVAQISFQAVGQLGDFSPLAFLDAQINSESVLGMAIDGSIEIILDELTITGQDNSGIGANHSITLGACSDCNDGWKYGEDEEDYPDPQGEYTNIHFFHSEWLGQEDENGNICNQTNFSTDYRKQHSFRKLTAWGLRGSTGNGLSPNISIELSWDSNKLNSTSSNFQMFIYIGETGYDMQQMDNIIISQSELTLNENNEPNIWVMLGECADTGETLTYYQDSDGDGLGGSIEGEFCEGLQPAGWVETNDGDTCDGDEDCLGICWGTAYLDNCGVCDSNTNNDNEQCLDCNSVPNGDSVLDNCGTCDNNVSNDCVMDCNGVWGGSAFVDDCGICEGPQIDGDLDGDGDICEIACTEALDCFGVCGGEAFTDDCGLCVGGTTDPCIPDCLGIPGGIAYLDDCNICDADSENDNQCVDCNGTVDGVAILDNCGNCVEDLSDSSYECEQDCNGIWGGLHLPTFLCQNGEIACNYNACFDLANNEFQLPQRFDINRIYPNPFNPKATIDFEISEPVMVQLNIYNLNGQKVDILKNAFTLPGHYSVIWNGTNHPSGIYFVILQSANSIVKQKMMLIK